MHVTPYLAPAWAYGSVPAAVWDLARAQAASSTSVAVLTTDAFAPHERQPVGAFTIDGVRVVRVHNVSGLIRTWLDTSTPLGLARRAREVFVGTPPDIVHLHELRTVENWQVIGSVPPGTPVIASTHGVWRERRSGKWLPRLQERLLRSVLRRLDHVVVQSDDEVVQVREMWARQGLSLTEERVSAVPANPDGATVERDLRRVYALVRSRAHARGGTARREC